MKASAKNKRILVIAPHPDDEILGVGGSIARWISEGAKVYVAIMTKVYAPLFDEKISITAREEAKLVHHKLGVTETFLFDYPVLDLQRVGHVEINRTLADLVKKIEPDIFLIPFAGDVHDDHKWIANACMVACRPVQSGSPSLVMAYETPSETNWDAPFLTPNFTPNAYVDIGAFLELKLDCMNLYASQSREAPHERSLEALKALAVVRGAAINKAAAEAFFVIRQVF